jgi:tRNA A58 N-methylase Trm61
MRKLKKYLDLPCLQSMIIPSFHSIIVVNLRLSTGQEVLQQGTGASIESLYRRTRFS